MVQVLEVPTPWAEEGLRSEGDSHGASQATLCQAVLGHGSPERAAGAGVRLPGLRTPGMECPRGSGCYGGSVECAGIATTHRR
jgi:hypothetical protein